MTVINVTLNYLCAFHNLIETEVSFLTNCRTALFLLSPKIEGLPVI